jgi:phenylacetate-coenzyme A ligase PaaK-like adenylate-forming protein
LRLFAEVIAKLMFINYIFNRLLCRRRLREIERVCRSPQATQQRQLERILRRAKDTVFGQQYDFVGINSIKTYQQRVPQHHYADLLPYIKRMLGGESNVLCAGQVKWFAKSSGTTGEKSKFIPVSAAGMNACHFRGTKDVIMLYLNQFPQSAILKGKGLTLGGSCAMSAVNRDIMCGDLSAILIENAPFVARFIRTPSVQAALIPDFEQKIRRIAEETVRQNVVQFAGVPSWNLVLMKHILDYTGKDNLLQVWPNLELFIHGGIGFAPYREQFQEIIPSPTMRYMETYNASEGFFAIQNDLSDSGMLLMLDYGVFYEFVPMSGFDTPQAQALTIGDVQMGVNYAMLISTQDGLFRYVIGDTVEFTSLAPYKIKITGRTKQYINVFGEELMVHNAEDALQTACKATGAYIKDYTVAPMFMSVKEKGRHQWLIEFEQQPADIDAFAKTLDQSLCNVNSDYEAKRSGNVTLNPPLVQVVREGVFYEWMRRRGKLGGQNKVPRLSNTREYAEQLMDIDKEDR